MFANKISKSEKNKNAKIMKIQSNGPRGAESELGGVKSKEVQAQPRINFIFFLSSKHVRSVHQMLSPDSLLF